MTDVHVEVVRVNEVNKHPNADALDLVPVGGYTCCVRRGDFQVGDLAVYIPVDSVVDTTHPAFAFLDGHPRIKAKKLRGIFSEGLLIKAGPGLYEGQDVAELLGVTKYLTPEERQENWIPFSAMDQKKKLNPIPDYLPRYTSVENWKKHPNAFNSSDIVIVTEKIEGENAGFAYNSLTGWQRFKKWLGFSIPDQVIVRSRKQLKTEGKWHDIIGKYNLKKRFESLDEPDRYSIYGESYGYTAGFDYGTDRSGAFLVFDVWDRIDKRWLNLEESELVCSAMGLAMAPVLYIGPYDIVLFQQLAEEDSVLGNHMREGVMIRSEYERDKPGVGRMILKLKSQRYMLRKDG